MGKYLPVAVQVVGPSGKGSALRGHSQEEGLQGPPGSTPDRGERAESRGLQEVSAGGPGPSAVWGVTCSHSFAPPTVVPIRLFTVWSSWM